MFLRVHFKKMYSSVNLILKLNIYVFSPNFKYFKYFKNDISSFLINILKIEKKNCLCLEVLL